jgi:ketosteroid isomerase-like protein
VVPKAGGDPIPMKGRASVVTKKIGGKWLYLVDHASVPLPPPAK